MERKEHLNWCKQRALEILDSGDGQEAMSSMISDLRKHEGTATSLQMGFVLMSGTNPNDHEAVKRFITGFN